MRRWMGVIFTVMLLVAAASVGCNSTSGTDTDASAVLTDDAHSNEADANYEVVFPQDDVNRIDIVIDEEDWQAMLDDMTDNYGEFGTGQGMDGGFPGGDNFPIPDGGRPQGGFPDGGNFSPPDGGMPQDGGFLNEGDFSIPEGEMPQGGGAPGGGMGAGMFDNETGNPIWSECTVLFDDTSWEHVGIRFKGQSSLSSTWGEGVWKLPFRLDFDQFEDDYPETEDQRFYGFKKLSLSSSWSDDSLIREKVTADFFREFGVSAPETAFYTLYVDYGEGPTYFGLYTMVEIPDAPMFDTQFGDDDGNLYKPSGSGATFSEGSFDESSFSKQSNEEEADWSDITALFDALHADARTSDPAAWRSGLESVFDVEGFLRWLAANTVMQNWDTYGSMSHNYYLYNDPSDGLLHWIPWDNNEALSSKAGPSSQSSSSLSLAEVSDQWPLISYLIDDENYYQMYLEYVNELVDGVFSVDHAEELCREAHDLIEPYVVGENGEQEGYTFLNSDYNFYDALDDLFEHIEERVAAALSFLSEQGIN